MINSIYVALSGMLAYQRGLTVISNNVANMNTPAFRGSVINFADVFNGSGDRKASDETLSSLNLTNGGVDASQTRLDLRTADPQQTGNPLDLFLKGAGFFVLKDQAGNVRYTREGNFEFDADGQLIKKAPSDAALSQNGTFQVMTQGADGRLAPITLGGLKLSPSKITSTVTITGNLSSGDTQDSLDSIDVVDSGGTKHTVRLSFTRDTTTSTDPTFDVKWNVTAFEGADQVGEGTLLFLNHTLTGISPLSMSLTLKGAAPQSVGFDFSGTTGIDAGGQPTPDGQVTGNSSLVVSKQDGFPTGTITSETFDANGVLKITYSNGQTANGAKLALAEISDDQGLKAIGDSVLSYTGSRPVALRAAGDDLTVGAQSLELSNVDLTTEFSDLILMQRGYQAASQVVSTANDMMQQLLDMRGRK